MSFTLVSANICCVLLLHTFSKILICPGLFERYGLQSLSVPQFSNEPYKKEQWVELVINIIKQKFMDRSEINSEFRKDSNSLKAFGRNSKWIYQVFPTFKNVNIVWMLIPHKKSCFYSIAPTYSLCSFPGTDKHNTCGIMVISRKKSKQKWWQQELLSLS